MSVSIWVADIVDEAFLAVDVTETFGFVVNLKKLYMHKSLGRERESKR